MIIVDVIVPSKGYSGKYTLYRRHTQASGKECLQC